MLRLTKKADYGLMALKYLAEQATLAAPHITATSNNRRIATLHQTL